MNKRDKNIFMKNLMKMQDLYNNQVLTETRIFLKIKNISTNIIALTNHVTSLILRFDQLIHRIRQLENRVEELIEAERERKEHDHDKH